MRTFMSRVAVVVTSTIMLTIGLLSVPTTAHADSPGCVTRHEFQVVKRSYTKKRVHNIFDTIGRRDSMSVFNGSRDEWRSYRVCKGWKRGRSGGVTINYDNYSSNKPGLRLYSKSVFLF